jgi:CubicO group peptidase (beta-lactamase class C family)
MDTGDEMIRHALDTRARSLLATLSLAVLAACGANTPAAPLTAARLYDNPAWPAAAVANPTALGFTADGLQSLEARMKQAVDNKEIAGINYALIKDGEVAALKVVGSQILGGSPMRDDTLFRVRSTGKTITAVAMMQLWEQGKWKPEDPITKFLPEFANLKVATSPDNLDKLVPVSHVPTMHEVMTHTAGFSYGLRTDIAADRAYRAADVLRAKDMKTFVVQVASLPLANQPGERWYYSVTYDLQGAIIERITGKTLRAYLDENLFTPMAMNDTGFWLTEADRPRLVTAHTRNTTTGVLEVYKDEDNFLSEDPFTQNSHFESGGGGASGLLSTLHDMVRFTQMLTNKGELGGKRILKPETVDLMMQNHIGAMRGVLGGPGYGFGYGGRVVVDGSTETTPQPNGAFSHFSIDGCWFWVDPANKLSFVGLIARRGGGPAGGVVMGGEGDAARLVYKALRRE